MLSKVSLLNKIIGLRFLKLWHNSNNLSLIKNAMSVFPPSYTTSLRYHNCERVTRSEILVGVCALKCICWKVVLWKNEKNIRYTSMETFSWNVNVPQKRWARLRVTSAAYLCPSSEEIEGYAPIGARVLAKLL